MNIFHYAENARDTEGLSLLYRTALRLNDNPSCIYCESNLRLLYYEDLLDGIPDNPLSYFNKQEHFIKVYFCPVCGWWGYFKILNCSGSGCWYIYDYGTVGVLKNLDLQDISTPLEDVIKFLLAKYEARFTMNPRLFEETVGSVFRNIGFEALVTAYSGDGGIDIILEKEDKVIGVQVKRTKKKIEAEQIRTLAGTLLYNKMNHGVFVTTSKYRSGAISVSHNYLEKGYKIDLIDDEKFFDALKISKIPSYRSYEDFRMVNDVSSYKLIRLFGDKKAPF